MAKNRNSIAKQIHLERLADDSHNRAKVKTQPAKKAKRKAREFILGVGTNIWGEPLATVDKVIGGSIRATDRFIRVREVLPRTRTRKGER